MAADPVVSVPDESLELYRCRKCRRLLFTSSTTLTHERGEGSVAFEKKKRGLAVQVPLDPCSSYFAEPVEWMRETLQIGSVDGKLLCPKCKARIGSFNWAGTIYRKHHYSTRTYGYFFKVCSALVQDGSRQHFNSTKAE